MKNIQVIDDADNCTYSVYEISDEWFDIVFENDADIEFSEDLKDRMSEELAARFAKECWNTPVRKSDARGIHGTLFYGLGDKKRNYYLNKRFYDDISGFSALQRRKFGLGRSGS